MRSTLFNLWFYGVTACLAVPGFLLSFRAGPRTLRGLLHFWTRAILFGLRRILGARIDILGRENLPADGRPALIVPKHQSELDAIVILNLWPDAAAIAMQELERYPFVGRIIRRLGYILVPVDGPPAGRTAAVVEGAQRVQGEGRPVLIYPEGTLMQLGARERYRSGVYHIYRALGVPAHPVAQSLGVIWPRREWHKTAGARGAVEFLPPIPPGLPKDVFMARLELEIEAATLRLIEAHAAPDVAAAARERAARAAAAADPAP